MKSLLLVLSALVVVCVAHEFQELHDLAWSGWKEKYNKTYIEVEEEYRRKIWENNLVYIEEFNAQELSYKLGPNHFADLVSTLELNCHSNLPSKAGCRSILLHYYLLCRTNGIDYLCNAVRGQNQ